MKKIVLKEIFKAFMSALAVGFVLFACLAQAIPLKNEPVVDIGDSVIRLRVVANSSKERDCEIKLAVRDALLKNAPELFGSCESPESARLAVRTNLFLVKRIAAEAVRECGSQDDVRVHFGYESAPVRRYGAYTFPADDYLTLRVDIGKIPSRSAISFSSASISERLTDEIGGACSIRRFALQGRRRKMQKNPGKIPMSRLSAMYFYPAVFPKNSLTR